MLIDRRFNEGFVARRAGANRSACPYADGEARAEWLAGFDKLVAIEVDFGDLDTEAFEFSRYAANLKSWLH